MIVDTDGADILIEVPHPFFDKSTSEVGVELFRQARARALLVAGAHRYSRDERQSDVVYAQGTAFDEAHRELLPAQYVIQPHGFDREKREDYSEVVLSGGVDLPSAGLQDIARALENAGLEVSLFDGGPRYKDLAGTLNQQGRSGRKTGG